MGTLPQKQSLSALFHAARMGLPPGFISSRGLAALAEIVAAVPPHAETAGFELRLTGDDGRVDLGVGLSLVDSSLADLNGDPVLHRAVIADERWRCLHEFGRHWVAESSWRLRAPFLFLEYDGDTPLHPVPVPSVFVGLDWPLEELGEEARRRGRENASLAPGLNDIKAMLAVLRREPMSDVADSLFQKCFTLMPVGGLVLHLGVMLGRPGAAVRLSLGVPCQDAPAYLDSLGWGAGLDALDQVFAFEADASGSNLPERLLQIDVDVGDMLGSAVGVMLQPSPAGSWRRLLDALTAAGYCDAGKRDGLLTWPGTDNGIERYPAHAKITCGSGIAPGAKAYIGVRPCRG